MAEDYASIAAEVEAALLEAADVSQPNGYPATIWRKGAQTGGSDFEPVYGDPTYYQVIVMVSDKEVRDMSGTLIGQTRRTVTISGAAGVTPTDDDRIYLGAHLTYVDATTDEGIDWQEIQAVRELAPAGVPVLYDMDLGS